MKKRYLYIDHNEFDIFLTDHKLTDKEAYCSFCDGSDQLVGVYDDKEQLITKIAEMFSKGFGYIPRDNWDDFCSITSFNDRPKLNEIKFTNSNFLIFGFDEKQTIFLRRYLNPRNIHIHNADSIPKLIAGNSTAIVVNAAKLDQKEVNFLQRYYRNVEPKPKKIIFWIGSPRPSMALQLKFICFNSLNALTSAINKNNTD